MSGIELGIVILVVNSTWLTLSVTSSVLKFKDKKEHKKKMIQINQNFLDELIEMEAHPLFIEDARKTETSSLNLRDSLREVRLHSFLNLKLN